MFEVLRTTVARYRQAFSLTNFIDLIVRNSKCVVIEVIITTLYSKNFCNFFFLPILLIFRKNGFMYAFGPAVRVHNHPLDLANFRLQTGRIQLFGGFKS